MLLIRADPFLRASGRGVGHLKSRLFWALKNGIEPLTKVREQFSDLSMHMATHFWSELPIEEPGDVMHFLKHFSVTFDNNS